MEPPAPAPDNLINTIVRMVMGPFVRVLLRYGVSHADFMAITRRLYVEIADRDFPIAQRRQTVARVSVLTGLTRREVKRILEEPEEHALPPALNRAGRVAGGWLRDKAFWDKNDQPASLSISSKKRKSFYGLVKKYGGDIPPRAVLDELLDSGAVALDGDLASLTSTGYVPAGDGGELLTVSMRSVGDLISTIDYNDRHRGDESLLQLTLEYDNVSDDGAEAFRILSREKSKEILLYLDRFLATQDRDANPNLDAEGRVRTGLSIFYFKDDKPEHHGDSE